MLMKTETLDTAVFTPDLKTPFVIQKMQNAYGPSVRDNEVKYIYLGGAWISQLTELTI